MVILVKFVLLIFCVSPIYSIENTSSDPIVQLPNGKIRGRDHGHYFSFESIPYAEPPIGELRFEAPKPFTGNWSDIRDATISPAKCMQWSANLTKQLLFLNQFNEDLLDGQEDCLTINIYTPNIGGKKTYPVLVLIPGESFMYGTADEYGHDLIMKNKNTVVVKMNYRLGALGFLSTEDDVITGNFGLKDQLLAFEWTKANVAAFNGNPESITAIGFMAGGASVHLHMMNRNFEKIANRAVSMSGSSISDWIIKPNANESAAMLAEHLDCPTELSSAMKSCLQNKNAADIVRAAEKLKMNRFQDPVGMPFGPVIESKTTSNAFLSEHPQDIVKNGNSAQIPWLISYTSSKDYNNEPNDKQVNRTVPDAALFYLLIPDQLLEYILAQDFQKAIELHTQYTNSSVYAYVFNTPAPYDTLGTISQIFGIPGGIYDFFLIFNSTVRTPDPFNKNQIEQSEKFIKLIEDFAANEKKTLQFGDCKFWENNGNTNGLYGMDIKSNSCETSNWENYTLFD